VNYRYRRNWEWFKEKLTAEDLTDKLLFAEDHKEKTAWHLATQNGDLQILKKLWEWGIKNKEQWI
jgi:hypothetical protein